MKLSVAVVIGLTTTLYAQAEMNRLMDLKLKQWARMRAEGVFDKFDNRRLQSVGPLPCANKEAGEYSCNSVSLFSFLSHRETGSTRKKGNDVWGKRIKIAFLPFVDTS